MAVLIIFSVLSLYYVYMRPSYFTPMTPFEVPKESHVIAATWEEFLGDCGGSVIVENNVHARNLFNHKYEANQVTWRGYYADTKMNQNAGLPFMTSDHALNILIKMEPSESVLYPDLVLSVQTKLA